VVSEICAMSPLTSGHHLAAASPSEPEAMRSPARTCMISESVATQAPQEPWAATRGARFDHAPAI